MKVAVTIDQAVWERSRFEIEVPDGLEGDALREAIDAAIDDYDDGISRPEQSQEILDEPVYGIDRQKVAELPDGSELEI